MKSDEVRVLALTKGETGLNIIKLTQEMVGHEEPATAKQKNPKSIRALFGEDLMKNAVHLSATVQEAEAELKVLFPNFVAPIGKNLILEGFQIRWLKIKGIEAAFTI